MMDLFEKLHSHYQKELPFAVYSKPNSDATIGVFQHDVVLHSLSDFTEKGFAFVSFNGEEKYYIPSGQADVYVDQSAHLAQYPAANQLPETDNGAKEKFENLVAKGVAAIKNGDFKKVVLSRVQNRKITGLDPVGVIKALQFHYPAAFNYIFYHPKIGFWTGATPEQFLQTEGAKIKTVALAGTQLYGENLSWETKEKQEQQFVTDFILQNLEKYSDSISASEPYTVMAGNLAHLKTDISADLVNPADLGKLIGLMHPTPAVCGLPKDEAKKFILGNEGYDRKFYTGFLGELNIDFKTFNTHRSDLFVNLRCMEIENQHTNIYVGCGITAGSDPQKEYTETQNKTMTMGKIVNLCRE